MKNVRNVHSSAFIAAVAAGAILAAMPLTAGSAAARDADDAAQSIYRTAVAGCDRMKAGEARRCMREAEAARHAAEIRARAMPGHANFMDWTSPPAAEGAPGSGTPTHWIAPDGKDVPDNLADNAAR